MLFKSEKDDCVFKNMDGCIPNVLIISYMTDGSLFYWESDWGSTNIIIAFSLYSTTFDIYKLYIINFKNYIDRFIFIMQRGAKGYEFFKELNGKGFSLV